MLRLADRTVSIFLAAVRRVSRRVSRRGVESSRVESVVVVASDSRVSRVSRVELRTAKRLHDMYSILLGGATHSTNTQESR